jgi:hypothetical protein
LLIGSIGLLLPNMAAKIVDEDGKGNTWFKKGGKR